MKDRNEERDGVLFLLANVVLAGIFPVTIVLSLKSIAPMAVLLGSTFFAVIYFALVMTLRKKWRDITNTEALKDIFWIVIFIGVGYQMLYFFGLSGTTAGNASIISLVEIFFSFLFFNAWRKERIPMAHVSGALLVLFGVMIIIFPKFDGFRWGDVSIMAAAAIAPFGNFFQRRARNKISGEAVMFLRAFFSLMVLLIMAVFFQPFPSWGGVKSVLPLLIINGIFMLGLMKSFWLEAIHRISVVKANAIGSLVPVVTLLIVWAFMHTPPTNAQMLSLLPIFAGFFLLNRIAKNVQLKTNA